MKIKIILFTLLILLSSLASAEFLTKGVNNENSFSQVGTGFWNETTGVPYTRTGSFYNYVSPVVGDVDNDGINEIIVMSGTELQILNFTRGIGILIEASVSVGSITHTGYDISQTPGIIDYDSDGYLEIIAINTTTGITYQWDGTTLTKEQSFFHATPISTQQLAKHPVIKCGNNTQFLSGAYTCVWPLSTGGFQLGLASYDLTNNSINISNLINVGNADVQPGNTHLVDSNNDGYLEVFYRVYIDANDDIFIKKFTIAADNSVTQTSFAQHLLGASGLFTDIIVSEMDGSTGNGKEITWGYTSDGVNWDGFTLHADGSTYASSYCGVLTCPEGERASFNLFKSPDTTYGVSTNDVCYYIKNVANNDPGANIDTVLCLSLFLGNDRKETNFANTQQFTNDYVSVYVADIYKTTSLLLPNMGFKSNIIKQAFPTMVNNAHTIPVDYQANGGLDIIGLNNSRMVYYDDNRVNEQVSIDNRVTDTGNPMCLNEVTTTTLTLSDNEGNTGFCHISEAYGNGTIIGTVSNTSFLTPGTVKLNYHADDVGTKVLTFKCQDQFNQDTYASVDHVITVVNKTNTTTCNIKGENPDSQSFEVTDTQKETATEAVEAVLDDYNLNSPGIKLFIGLLLALGCGLYVFKETKGDRFLSGLGALGGIILAVAFSFIEVWVIATIVIVVVAFIVYKLMGGGKE